MASNYQFHDLRPSKISMIRRMSMESLRVYTGLLSEEHEYVSVEAEKGTTAEDVVVMACRKLRLGNGVGAAALSEIKQQYELAEVFSSGGQLCKERRLDATEYPVQLQLLWPKVMPSTSDIESPSQGPFDGYRFYLRRKDPEVPASGGWVVSDQTAVDSFLLAFLTHPLAGKEFPDLCSLPDLNEHTLLHNLKARFNQKNIYTYVGSILIAVNPFKFFPIYNPKYVSMYQNKRLGELPPHIFAVADAAYHSMLRLRQNQCIVISGESGSGKTESTNLLLHHLTALSHKGLHGSGVEQTILGAGPVLEAFGNAKTVHNNNSSRFGKFIQVNYKQNGMVHGAIVEKYLLEKSRIVFQARDERNYHVFYYLLAGADEKEREMFQLAKAEEYNYLNKSSCYSVVGMDEQHEFSRLKQSMEMVGFSPETQKKIFSVLSAVLHLGNVEFKKKGDKHHDESVVVKAGETVRIISQLLKVKEKYVLEALTQKKTTAGDETFFINYRMDDAIATRNAMAKCIYGALFDWIVLKVNQALLAKKHDSEHEGESIGVLDIFGFEDFGRNSFEQFCINYANEHLQYYFNQHIFKFEQEEYQREGIQWKNIEFIDNTGSLEIFSKRPSGLFSLLDEECSFPAATNETLLSKFTHNHRHNPHYQVPQLKEGSFSIMHYAGRVKYFAKDFREKNLDLVRPEIVATLKKSSMAFVRELMGIDPVAVLRWSVVRAFFRCFFAFIKAGERYRKNGGQESRRRQTQSKRLSDSNLPDVLSENLLNSSPAALRCRLPSQGPTLRIPEGVAQKLEADPELQHHREEVHEELLMYSSLENSLPENDARVIRRARKLLMKNKSFKPKPRPSLSFRDIKALKAIASRSTPPGSSRGSGNKKQPPTVGAQFQWSLSRLMTTLNQANPYFIRCIKSNSAKAPCVFDEEVVMRQLRYTGMLATVKIRQSGYNYRLLFEEFTQLYKILLPHKREDTTDVHDIRIFLNSMGLQQENYQIGKNKIFLRESEKLRLDEALHSAIMQRVVKIQRWVKTCLERQAYLRLRESAIIIQKHIRRYLAQQYFHEYQLIQLQHSAAIMIQTHFRCYLARQNFNAQRYAVVYIQSYIRACLQRRRFFELRDEYHAQLAKQEEERREKERLELERIQREEEEENERIRAAEKEEREEAERKAKEAAERLAREKLEAEQKSVVERLESERRRERKEELQSTASDEGVLVKASSNEELEDKEFHQVSRRDSEESSGIMEDSETEGTELSKTGSEAPSSPRSRRQGEASSEEQAPQRMSRVMEIAKTFQQAADEENGTERSKSADEMDGRVLIIRRGSQRWKKNKRSVAPLARQESFSDWDISPPEPRHSEGVKERPAPLEIPGASRITEENRRQIEAVVSNQQDVLRRRDEQGQDTVDLTHGDLSGHLSPLRKAREHLKNWVGDKLEGKIHHHHHQSQHQQHHHSISYSCIPSSPGRSFKFFRAKSTKKKREDSEEESDDVIPSPSRKNIDHSIMGVSVLPQLPFPASLQSPRTMEESGSTSPIPVTDPVFKPSPSHWHNRGREKKKQRRPEDHKKGTSPSGVSQSRTNMKVARSTEWQYADNMVITDIRELGHLDEFIARKVVLLYGDTHGGRRFTVLDKIFRSAIDKFRKDLKTIMAIEAQKQQPMVRYRDLFEQFKQILEAEMKREQTDAPLIMSVNAFRGFLDEFRKQQEVREKENKKDDRRMEKKHLKREKKKLHDTLEHNGHRYLQVQFNIPTFCEVCSTLIWLMDKGYMCQECKLACHKKCYAKNTTSCKGTVENKNQASCKLFGSPLEFSVNENQRVPLVCELLMSTIERTGLYTEGVYRKAGALPKVKELKNALETDLENINLEDYHVHVLASTLKSYLRSLPEPLLTFGLFDDFLRCTEIKDEREVVRSLFEVLKKLPRPNFDLFERLMFHLASVAMHCDSNKMSPNALSVVFAPVLLGTNKNIQAQEAIALVPQQMLCIEYVLKEEIRTVKSKFDDIETLESAEKTTGERLNIVRASLRSARQKSPLASPVKQVSLNQQEILDTDDIDVVLEEEEEEEGEATELVREAKALSRHLASIHKEKDKLTYKLPLLETRQASSDEDVLSVDEMDAIFEGMNEEYAVNFDIPATRPSLPHINKSRPSGPYFRKLPKRFAGKVKAASSLSSVEGDTSEACLPEPIPTISIRNEPQYLSGYAHTMTVESSYVTVPGILSLGDEDEIMV